MPSNDDERSRSNERRDRRGKRASGSAGQVDAQDGEDPPVTMSKVQELFQRFRTDLSSSVTESVNAKVSTLVADLDEGYQAQFREHARGIAELGDRADNNDERIQHLEGKVSDLSRRLGVAESSEPPTREFIDEADDNRMPIPYVLRINTEALVSKAAIVTAMQNLAKDAKLPENSTDTFGLTAGRYFKVVCNKGSNMGAITAASILNFVRNDGDWRSLSADSPGGPVRFYIDEDKSPRQKRVELGGRKLRQAFAEVAPDLHIQLRKKEAQISADKLSLARALSPAPGKFSIEFNYPCMSRVKVDPAKIRTVFQRFFSEQREDVPWKP